MAHHSVTADESIQCGRSRTNLQVGNTTLDAIYDVTAKVARLGITDISGLNSVLR